MKLLPVALLLALVPALGATQAEQQPVRQMAITIDDLPANCTCDPAAWQELTDGLLAHLTERRVPAIGFVNEVKLYPDLSGPDRIARWDIAVPPVDLDEIEPSPRRVALLAQWLLPLVRRSCQPRLSSPRLAIQGSSLPSGRSRNQPATVNCSPASRSL